MRLYLPVAVAFLAGALSSGCQAHLASNQTPPRDGQIDDDEVASELRDHHRHHHRGGITQFIAMSLDTLGVDDAKRPQVEKVQAELNECMVPTRAIEHLLLLTYADGVAAGTIPSAKVDEDVAKLNAAAASLPGCSAPPLDRLHALLSPSEREALIDKVEAHWEVWRQVNAEAEVSGRGPGGRIVELTQELALTPTQVETIATALAASPGGSPGTFDPKVSEAHLQTFSTAFAKASFDARSITGNASGHLMSHGARRMGQFYDTITPLLTPEQREKLSRHLRDHANHQATLSSN